VTPGRRQLGEDLRKLRHDRSLRQEDVAAVLGIAPSTLSRIERGEVPTRSSYLTTMLDIYGVGDPAQRTRLTRLAREGRRPATAARDALPTLKEARQAATAYLAQTGGTNPGTAPAVLLRRLAEGRAVIVDLLAASAGPGQPHIPVPLLRFTGTWSIRRELDAWVAEQRHGTTVRVLASRKPAQLAVKLTAVETAG
jgi:transcriptional regulator with XRE-family HTH domain